MSEKRGKEWRREGEREGEGDGGSAIEGRSERERRKKELTMWLGWTLALRRS
jgi:hypothetical protein